MNSVLVNGCVMFNSETRLEYIISQFQASASFVMMVKDGYLTLCVNRGQIPQRLKLDLIRKNDDIGTMEFHYRSVDNDSTYTLFDPAVHSWIQEGRINNDDNIGNTILINRAETAERNVTMSIF